MGACPFPKWGICPLVSSAPIPHPQTWPQTTPHPIMLLTSEKGNYVTNHTDTLPEFLKNIPTDLPQPPTSPSQPHGGEPKLFRTGTHPFSRHAPSSCLHPFRNPKTPQKLSDPGGRAVSGLQNCFLRELWLEVAEFGLESQECSLSKQ